MTRPVFPALLAMAAMANTPTGGSLQGLYWAVTPPRKRARPEKKAERKAQKQARKANRGRK